MQVFKKGYIHSIETMGLVDGPGIRIVIFMQGCKLRCSFCHNPDTWSPYSEKKLTSNDVVNEIRKYRPYIEQGGGVTFSGGEPLYQSEFLLEMLKLCKKSGIHTCIDTAGVGYEKEYLESILKYTDLVILDIKALDPINYKKITSYEMDEFNYFVKELERLNKKIWLRQVIIPSINDNSKYIFNLKEYIKKFNNVEKIELLPYHLLGIDKYKKMGINYTLKDIDAMDKGSIKKLEELLKN